MNYRTNTRLNLALCDESATKGNDVKKSSHRKILGTTLTQCN